MPHSSRFDRDEWAVWRSSRTSNWTYDGIYRLTNETISLAPSGYNGSVSYGLDPVGNRLSDTSTLSGVSSGTFNFNSDDELLSENYDLSGNVTYTGGKSYTYDSENHMTSANNGVVRLIYDGDGYRVAKIVNGVITQYLLDDLNPTGLPQVVEEVVNGAVIRQYTYGLQRISENQIINGAWAVSFYGYDGGGSVRQLTNSAGIVTDEYVYDAYGNSFTKQGTTPNNYLYRGEQFDSDLGLYYLRARYYNPTSGRFMSRDPEDGDYSDPTTLHKYLYVNGDPVNRVDPTGRLTEVMEYVDLTSVVALRNAAAAITLGAAIACVYEFEGTSVFANVKYGIDFGLGKKPYIERTGPCSEKEKSKETCHEEHPDWPVNYVHYSTTPLIAAHVALALDMGYPDALTYLGPYNPLQGINRRAACPSGKYASLGMSCDEYPYASTAQGGAGASTAPVPLSQQLRQGWELQQFYANIRVGQDFCVEVVP